MENTECLECSGGDFAFETRKNIEERGLSIVGTSYEIDIGMLAMTYSVGITETLGKPELIIFGVSNQHAAAFINMYYDFLKEGRTFEPGVDYDEFAEGFKTRFKEISTESYMDHLCKAAEFNIENNHELKAMQMLYPDEHGIWAEDSQDERFKQIAIELD